MILIGIIIGLFIGASLGVVIAGLCAAAGREPEGRWIPVSERLPKYGEPSLTIYHTKNATSQITIRCLVEDRDDELRVIWYDIENGLWVNENNITHWMPLPEPPEEK